MIVGYEINENDFLTFQLFTASKSASIIKKRRRAQIRVPIIYLIFVVLLLLVDAYVLAGAFAVIAVLWFLFYPRWESRRYLNHYKTFIKEHYKNRSGRNATMEINDDVILTKENGSEGKLLTIELEEIVEIPTVILMRLKGGQAFVLPKDRINNLEELKSRLKELASYLKIKYSVENEWEWK